MTIVLGIDASYTGFGLAALETSAGFADVVTLTFPADRFGDGIERLLTIESAFAEHLRAWNAESEIEHVCLEGYAYQARNGREKAGELGAIVKRTLLGTLGDPAGYPTLVTPGQLKQFVTGKGNSTKYVIVKDVLRKWGRDLADHNAADAFGLAKIAEAIIYGAELDYEKAVIRKLKPHTEKTHVTTT